MNMLEIFRLIDEAKNSVNNIKRILALSQTIYKQCWRIVWMVEKCRM